MLSKLSIFALLFLSFACGKDEVFDDSDLLEITHENKPILPPPSVKAHPKAKEKNEEKDKSLEHHDENSSQNELCKKIVDRFSLTLNEQKKSLVITQPLDPLISDMISLTPHDCEDPSKHEKTFAIISHFLRKNSQKVAVVLPLSKDKKKIGEAVLKGLRSAFIGDDKGFNDLFIIKDNEGSDKKTLNLIAEMVLTNNITFLVVAAASSQGVKDISSLIHNLILPTFIIYKDSQLLSKSPFLYHVFPREESVAHALAAAVKAKQIPSMSILRPSSGKADKLSEQLVEELNKLGVKVPQTISYTSGNYHSMSQAAMILAGTDPKVRAAEYQQLLADAEKKAKENGQIFNPRFTVLKPILQASAVFIPDNYRIVRHFINLFKYQGIKNLTLVGNNEWRAKAIMEPWEPYLKGSFFSDYVGPYNNLPKGLEFTLDGGSPYFVPIEQIVSVDIQYLGFRVGLLASQLSKESDIKRYQWQKKILAYRKEPIMKDKTSFSDSQCLNWPAYVFSFKNGDLDAVLSD